MKLDDTHSGEQRLYPLERVIIVFAGIRAAEATFSPSLSAMVQWLSGYRSHFGHVRKVPRHDECEIIGGTRKHRYFLPLTPRMKEIALKMQKSYPKRATSKENVAPGVNTGEGARYLMLEGE